jgi:glycerol kinase
MDTYLLSIDQGTTGSKILLVNRRGDVVADSYQKHTQYYPRSGWTEHDPEEIWENIRLGVSDVLSKAGAEPNQVMAVGLANQGETVLFWDAENGAPLYPAIVWSCRRSDKIAERWERDGDWAEKVMNKTGLRIDPYFSATKIRWMMEEVEAVQEKIRQNQAYCSTLDAWLIWKMTGGASYVTDASTAARTLLFNHRAGRWDEEILAYLEIKESWLPKILPTVTSFGQTDPDAFCGIDAPIRVSLVDQPAALYGHLCVEPGMSKCTYGTGCFAYMNVGTTAPPSVKNGLLTTVVWQKQDQLTYALDGAVYAAGSAIEWGMESLGLYRDIEELQSWSLEWLKQMTDTEHPEYALTDEMFIPALNGIASPYWNSEARGQFVALSHATDRKSLAKAILDGIAHRVADLFSAMEEAVDQPIRFLRVDGGLTRNPYLMQMQANVLGVPIQVQEEKETTSMGIIYMLGEACGWWQIEELQAKAGTGKTYMPLWSDSLRRRARMRWKQAILHLLQYSEEQSRIP